MLACGTNAFSPNCTWREVSAFMRISTHQDFQKFYSFQKIPPPRSQLKKINNIVQEDTGIAKCPHSPHANVTSLISEDGSFFAGTPLGFAGTDSAIVRDSNKLKFLRTTQFDSKWLNEPQFVGSFETDTFVYFLFREGAVEYMNCGKVN